MLVCLLSACSSDRLAQDIVGTWILEWQDTQVLDDKDLVVLEFQENGQMKMAKMYGPSPRYKSRWIESDGNHYHIKGRQLVIEGFTGNNLKFEQTSRMLHIDSTHFCKEVLAYSISNIDQITTRGHAYEQGFRKADTDYPKPLGLWEVTQLNDKRFRGFRFEFRDDGSYDLWMEVNGEWEKKSDNNGTWYAYDNILCTNFFNDIFKTELSYEYICQCFHYEIHDQYMILEAYTASANSYVMRKVNENSK